MQTHVKEINYEQEACLAITFYHSWPGIDIGQIFPWGPLVSKQVPEMGPLPPRHATGRTFAMPLGALVWWPTWAYSINKTNRLLYDYTAKCWWINILSLGEYRVTDVCVYINTHSTHGNKVHPKNYAYGLYLALFTHILQGYFSKTCAITNLEFTFKSTAIWACIQAIFKQNKIFELLTIFVCKTTQALTTLHRA